MKIKNDQDSAWKEILEINFKDFIDYCLPDLSKLIDWKKKWTSLDKELQAITKGTEHGKRLVDKLFKVYLKDGTQQWILVHLEVQSQKEEAFPERMFVYSYRIYDKYKRMPVSCAILTDENKKWRPNHFELGLAGAQLGSKFLVVKLIDYQNKTEELESSNNPFASVILVHLAALEAKRKPDQEKKRIKFALTKRLYEKGYDKQQVVGLYKFIDWLIGLSEKLELEYLHEIHQLEEAKKMPYISRAERWATEKGREEGVEKTREEIALNLLRQGTDIKFIAKVTGLKLEEIKRLKEKSKN